MGMLVVGIVRPGRPPTQASGSVVPVAKRSLDDVAFHVRGFAVDRISRWSRVVVAAAPVDHAHAEEAARRACATLGIADPTIVWARSPAEARLLTARSDGPDAGDEAGAGRAWLPPDTLQLPVRAEPELVVRVRGSAASVLEEARAGDRAVDAGLVQSGLVAPGGRRPSGAFALTNTELARLLTALYLDTHGIEPLPAGMEAVRTLIESTGGFWRSGTTVVLAERPTEVSRDTIGRLDRRDGPAVRWADGTVIWATEGHVIPDAVAEQADRLSVAEIQALEPAVRSWAIGRGSRTLYVAAVASSPALIASEADRAIAREALALCGEEPFVRGTGMVIDTDLDAAGRMRRLWRADRRSDDRVVMVEVVNSTPGPDGSRHHHFLRVPPGTRTCADAVAWTFGMPARDYTPEVET